MGCHVSLAPCAAGKFGGHCTTSGEELCATFWERLTMILSSCLEDALTTIDFEDLMFHLGVRAIESDDKASHRLLHLKPVGEGESEFSHPSSTDSYTLSHTELASPYIKELVLLCSRPCSSATTSASTTCWHNLLSTLHMQNSTGICTR